MKAILLDPLPYQDPDRLVALYEAGVIKGDAHDEPAAGNFYDWRRQTRSFQEIAAYGGANANLSGGGERLPEHVDGVFCSWNLFRTLGVSASEGRVFTAHDDRPTAVSSATTQFWIPMQIALSPEDLATRGDHRLFVMGRLAAGVSMQRATAEMTGLASANCPCVFGSHREVGGGICASEQNA